MDIGEDKVRISIIRFSTSITPILWLNDSYEKSKVKEKIKNIRYNGGGTNTDKALVEVNIKALTLSNGDRPSVPDQIFVITDGDSYQPKRTAKAARDLQDRNVEMVSIGVGSSVKDTELLNIASHKDFALRVESFDELKSQSLNERLFKATCEGLNPTTTTSTTTLPSTEAPSTTTITITTTELVTIPSTTDITYTKEDPTTTISSSSSTMKTNELVQILTTELVNTTVSTTDNTYTTEEPSTTISSSSSRPTTSTVTNDHTTTATVFSSTLQDIVTNITFLNISEISDDVTISRNISANETSVNNKNGTFDFLEQLKKLGMITGFTAAAAFVAFTGLGCTLYAARKLKNSNKRNITKDIEYFNREKLQRELSQHLHKNEEI